MATQRWVQPRLTSTGCSKLFCPFFSRETKLGPQLYSCVWQGKSLYTIGRVLVCPENFNTLWYNFYNTV